ncbi:hypothetical protein G6F60_014416 [Rhizopus arrhizus]|nr:hypothetical protein G6F60_014416 [Rhizopus arrhizus]
MGVVDRCREQRRAHGHVLGQVLVDHPVEQVDRPDELGHEAVGRLLIDLVRLADLLDPAGIHHRDAGGHGHRFFLIVGDEDEGDAQLALQVLKLQLHALAQLQVQRGQRFVQHQQLGLVDDGARQRHPLLLAAGHLAGVARTKVRQPHHVQRRAGTLGGLGL